MTTPILFLTALLVSSPPAETLDVADLSLEELLDSKVTIATRRALSIRESPSVISVITREEITALGARDLVDVLRQVPGFNFAVDVQGVVGVGFRGIWGHEGKALLLIDGQEMNELLYSTLQFGHHYPLHNVERIEIIRGPGSVIYGGFAELTVINLVSRSSDELDGGSFSATAGTYERASGHWRVGGALSKRLGSDGSISISASAGEARRSTDLYTDYAGQTADLTHSSRLQPGHINGQLSWKGLRARVIYDHYAVDTADGYGDVVDPLSAETFKTFIAAVEYDYKLSERWTLTPKVSYRQMTPWEEPRTSHPFFYTKTASRTLGGLGFTFEYDPTLAFNGGVEGYVDHSWLNSLVLVGTQSLFADDAPSVTYANFAAYAQALWNTPFVNLSAGARFEQHSAVGPSFVPRIGATKVFGNLHAKLLWSNAFRAPGIENLRLSPTIRPERTSVFEAEVGYQLFDWLYAGANVFDITIQDPIIYTYDAVNDVELYENYPLTGSRGVELEGRFRLGKYFATGTYSFAFPAGKNQVDTYALPSTEDAVLGIPRHKVTLHGSAPVWGGISVAPSVVWTSTTAGVMALDVDGNSVYGSDPPRLLANLFVHWKDPGGVAGLEVSAGVQNLLDSPVRYLQPYDGGHAPLAGARREFVARVGYQFDVR